MKQNDLLYALLAAGAIYALVKYEKSKAAAPGTLPGNFPGLTAAAANPNNVALISTTPPPQSIATDGWQVSAPPLTSPMTLNFY